MSNSTLTAYCYSEKTDVTIGFGISLDTDTETIESLGTEWIDIGLSESFWENHNEFEPGLEQALQLVENNPNLSQKQALYSVFGNFLLSYELDGNELNHTFNYDANQAIYDMLEF
jgi:hypothetical protein